MCKIIRRKKSGKIELFTGMFLLVFLVLLLFVQIQLMLFFATGLYMEDALASSNLASAVMDVEEYGKSHVILINSPKDSYALYLEALKVNLELNEEWESSNHELISGPVKVLQYVIYNVRKEDVTIYSFEEDGLHIWEEQGGLGSVYTPDGTLVESTSVYSRIGFPVKGILGISVYACKDKSVDIIANN